VTAVREKGTAVRNDIDLDTGDEPKTLPQNPWPPDITDIEERATEQPELLGDVVEQNTQARIEKIEPDSSRDE